GRSLVADDERLLICSNLEDGFDIYNLETRELTRTLPSKIRVNVALSLAAAGPHAILGSSCGEVMIADVLSGRITQRLHHGPEDIVQAVVHPSSLAIYV
ncbi:hypothetical protein DFP72DRAFT_819961, partial [Ephemerocybe angulata]